MEIQLAGRTYTLEEQGLGRIRRKMKSVAIVFGPMIGGVTDEVPTEMGEAMHEALQVFIPDLAPIGELMGYSTQADYERVEAAWAEYEAAAEKWAEDQDGPKPEPPDEADLPTYSAKKDVKPTEIFAAIEAIFEEHGGQRLVRLLKSVFGAEALSAVARSRLLAAEAQASRSRKSQN